jgi:hypothetical protein
MLHACVEKFDVMGERGNILGWDREVNKACIDFTSTTATAKTRYSKMIL